MNFCTKSVVLTIKLKLIIFKLTFSKNKKLEQYIVRSNPKKDLYIMHPPLSMKYFS